MTDRAALKKATTFSRSGRRGLPESGISTICLHPDDFCSGAEVGGRHLSDSTPKKERERSRRQLSYVVIEMKAGFKATLTCGFPQKQKGRRRKPDCSLHKARNVVGFLSFISSGRNMYGKLWCWLRKKGIL